MYQLYGYMASLAWRNSASDPIGDRVERLPKLMERKRSKARPCRVVPAKERP